MTTGDDFRRDSFLARLFEDRGPILLPPRPLIPPEFWDEHPSENEERVNAEKGGTSEDQ